MFDGAIETGKPTTVHQALSEVNIECLYRVVTR